MSRAHERAIAFGLGWHLAARVATLIASLLAQVVIARVLGPSGVGLVAAAWSAVSIGGVFADVGLNISVSRYLADAHYVDRSRLRRIVLGGLAAKVALTAAVAVGLYHGARPIAHLLGEDEAAVALLALASAHLVTDSLAAYLLRALQGLHRHGLEALGQAVSGIATPSIALLLVVVGHGAAGVVVGRAAGAGLATLVAGIALAVAVAQSAPHGDGSTSPPPDPLAGKVGGYALRIFVYQLATLALFRLDRALVLGFLGAAETGRYSVPATIVEQLLAGVMALAAVVAPYFAAIGDPAREGFLRTLLERSVRLLVMAYVPAAAGLCLLAPEILGVVFGPAFAPAASTLRVFSVVLVLFALVILFGSLLDYMGMARLRVLAYAVAAVAGVGLMVLLLPPMGILGAATALVIVLTPLTTLYGVALLRRLRGSAARLALEAARAGVAAAAMVGAVAGLRYALAPIGRVDLGALVVCGAVVYGLVMFAVGGLRREDLRELRRLRQSPSADEERS